MISPKFLDRFLKHFYKLEKSQIKGVVTDLHKDYMSFFYVLNSLSDYLFILDADFIPLFCNQSARDFFLIESSTYTHPIQNMTHYSHVFKRIEDFVKTQKQSIKEEIIIEGFSPKIWEIQFINFLKDPYFKKYQSSMSYLFCIEDITEKRQRLEKKEIGKNILSMEHLAAALAHEIKNPLASIHLYLDLLKRNISEIDNPDLQAEISQSLRTVEDEVVRINDITTEFLTTIRPLSLNMEKISLRQFLLQTLEILSMDMKNSSINLIIKEQDNLPDIIGDKRYLKIVFFNIIKNAIQSLNETPSQEKKEILITLEEHSFFVEIAVKDNGKGIEKENLQKIFQPYFTTKKDGSGVGLPLVYKIVHEHHGEIQIQSILNQGAVCSVFLPTYGKRNRKLLQNYSA